MEVLALLQLLLDDLGSPCVTTLVASLLRLCTPRSDCCCHAVAERFRRSPFVVVATSYLRSCCIVATSMRSEVDAQGTMSRAKSKPENLEAMERSDTNHVDENIVRTRSDGWTQKKAIRSSSLVGRSVVVLQVQVSEVLVLSRATVFQREFDAYFI